MMCFTAVLTSAKWSSRSKISSQSSLQSSLWLFCQLWVSKKMRTDLMSWISDHSRRFLIFCLSLQMPFITCFLHCSKVLSKFCRATPWYFWLPTSFSLLFTYLTIGHSIGASSDKDLRAFTELRVFWILVTMSAPPFCREERPVLGLLHTWHNQSTSWVVSTWEGSLSSTVGHLAWGTYPL